MPRQLFRRGDPAVVAGVVAGGHRIGEGRAEGLHFRRRPRAVARLGRDVAAHEVRHGGDRGIGGVLHHGLQLQLGGCRIVHAGLHIGDARPVGGGAGADAGMGDGVGRQLFSQGLQAPGQDVPVLVVELGRPAGTAAGGGAHGLAHPPGSLLVAEPPGRVHHIVVGGPVVRLELQGFAVERQGRLWRLAEVAQPIAPLVEQIGPLRGAHRGVGGLGEGHGVGVAAEVDEIDVVQRWLRLAVDIFRGLGGELGEIVGPAGEGLGQHPVAAHGERQASGLRLHQVAVDVQVVAEALLQQPVDLADGHPGLGDLDLDVAGPGAGQVALGRRAARGGLQSGQFVQQAARHHLARQAPGRQRRRRVEGLHHHRARGEGVVQHDRQPQQHHARHQDDEHLGGGGQPAGEALHLQVRQLHLAMLVPMFGFQVGQMRLAPEIGRRLPRQLRIGLGRPHGRRRGGRIQRDLGGRRLAPVIVASDDPVQQPPLRHVAPALDCRQHRGGSRGAQLGRFIAL